MTSPALRPPSPSLGEGLGVRLKVMIEHTKLFEKMLRGHKNFAIMKKHYKAYVNGFNGAKELRIKLMGAENAIEVEKLVEAHFLESLAQCDGASSSLGQQA